jgi:polyisoprenoid-binding protein YceI
VTIPVEDINVDSPETLDYLLDLEMFDVDQWPTATFKAESCSLDSLNSFTSEGTLTIRDQTHPISFPFTLDIETCDGQVCFHLTSEVTVNRLDFGVGQGYWANTATIPNEVGIEIDVYAVQK